MDAKIKKRWVNALRSGRFKQGRRRLRQRNENGEVEYCCLGVLCQIAVAEGVIPAPKLIPEDGAWAYAGTDRVLPDAVLQWAGILSETVWVGQIDDGYANLATLNDTGSSFEEIADIIEERL